MPAAPPTLRPGRPLSSRTPVVALEPTLKPGRYQVQLVVQGHAGLSRVARLWIQIEPRVRGQAGPDEVKR